MIQKKDVAGSNSIGIFDTPLLSSASLDWPHLHLFQWQAAAPQETYEATLARHLIVIHTTPQVVGVLEWADGFRAEGLARPGDVNLLSAGEEAFCRWDSPLSFLRLELSPIYLQQVAATIDHPKSDQLQVVHAFHKQDPKIVQISQWLLAELNQGGLGGQLYVDSLVNVLALHLLRYYTTLSSGLPRSQPSNLTPQEVTRAIDYMQTHFSRNISLAELAQAVHVSPAYLGRLFKRSTGLAPHQFLIQLRVNRAKELLLTKTLSISEVATQVGFADQSHLNRHVKRLLGVTPKAILTGK